MSSKKVMEETISPATTPQELELLYIKTDHSSAQLQQLLWEKYIRIMNMIRIF